MALGMTFTLVGYLVGIHFKVFGPLVLIITTISNVERI